MPVRSLVVVLDGLSFVIAETFNWFMGEVGEWYRRQRRRMMYITQPPNTFTVHNTFMTGLGYGAHGVCGHADALQGKRSRYPYLWEDTSTVQGRRIMVYGVPVSVPPAYVPREIVPRSWHDYLFLPRERFEVVLNTHLARIKALLQRRWDLAIVWVPVPDQAHHYFFPAVTGPELQQEMVKWYARALRIARELVEASEAEEWLVISDHGLSSVVEEGPCGPYHHRDGIAMGSVDELPRSDLAVYGTVKSML